MISFAAATYRRTFFRSAGLCHGSQTSANSGTLDQTSEDGGFVLGLVSSRERIFLAGIPPQNSFGGIFVFGDTMDIDAIIEFAPMCTPLRIPACPPITTLSSTVIPFICSIRLSW